MFPDLNVNGTGAVNNDVKPNASGTAQPADDEIVVFDEQPEEASVDKTTFSNTEENSESNQDGILNRVMNAVKDHPAAAVVGGLLAGLPGLILGAVGADEIQK